MFRTYRIELGDRERALAADYLSRSAAQWYSADDPLRARTAALASKMAATETGVVEVSEWERRRLQAALDLQAHPDEPEYADLVLAEALATTTTIESERIALNLTDRQRQHLAEEVAPSELAGRMPYARLHDLVVRRESVTEEELADITRVTPGDFRADDPELAAIPRILDDALDKRVVAPVDSSASEMTPAESTTTTLTMTEAEQAALVQELRAQAGRYDAQAATEARRIDDAGFEAPDVAQQEQIDGWDRLARASAELADALERDPRRGLDDAEMLAVDTVTRDVEHLSAVRDQARAHLGATPSPAPEPTQSEGLAGVGQPTEPSLEEVIARVETLNARVGQLEERLAEKEAELTQTRQALVNLARQLSGPSSESRDPARAAALRAVEDTGPHQAAQASPDRGSSGPSPF
jgi:hypothetical protein